MEKPTRICAIDGCGKPHLARGWCSAHWARWKRHGDPLGGGPSLSKPPADGKCTIEGCGRSHRSLGYCDFHYKRVWRHGDPMPDKPARPFHATPEETFRTYTEWRGDCLIWTGEVNESGYGRLWDGTRKVQAHRFAWERVNGPIPDGIMLDHRDHCDTRCVNVAHLREATNAQNQWNRSGPPVTSSTGVRNVQRRPNGRYQVAIWKNGEHLTFGHYGSIEEASAVAERERARLFGEFAGRG